MWPIAPLQESPRLLNIPHHGALSSPAPPASDGGRLASVGQRWTGVPHSVRPLLCLRTSPSPHRAQPRTGFTAFTPENQRLVFTQTPIQSTHDSFTHNRPKLAATKMSSADGGDTSHGMRFRDEGGHATDSCDSRDRPRERSQTKQATHRTIPSMHVSHVCVIQFYSRTYH